MKVLMFLRDPLPPVRPDVQVLFDRALRQWEIHTDYVGAGAADATNCEIASCQGRLFVAPKRRDRLGQLMAAVVNDIAVLARHGRLYDVVVVRDRPIEAALLFAVAYVLGCRTAYWMSFPVPLSDRLSGRRQMGAGRLARGLAVYLRGVVGEFVQRFVTLPLAQRVFAQSEAMVRTFARTESLRARSMAVPMGVDIDAIRRVQSQGHTTSEALDDGANWIVYLGAVDRVRRLDVLVDAMAKLSSNLGDTRLAIIGGANDDADLLWLKDYVAERGLGSRIRFVPPVLRERAWALAMSARCGVSAIPPGTLFSVSSPTKLIEYMALGLPCVASRIPEQELVLSESGAGICVDYSADKLCAAIEEILSDPARASEMSRRGASYASDRRSYKTLAKDVASAFLNWAEPGSDTPRPSRFTGRADSECG